MNISYLVDCGFTQWSNWTSCSVTCGVGEQKRTRKPVNPPASNGGLECSGDKVQTLPCYLYPCAGKCESFFYR